jgi:hypothetical protein
MRHDRHVRTLCSILYSTGCPLSDALYLTPRQVDCADQVIMVERLKKRCQEVSRAVPVPPAWLDILAMVHVFTESQRRHRRRERAQPL